MLQPHMIAVKLGRMGALSLPAGMGLCGNGLQPCNQSAVAGEEEARDIAGCWCTILGTVSVLIWALIKTATVELFSQVLATVLHLVQVHKYTDALINGPFGCHVHVMLGF